MMREPAFWWRKAGFTAGMLGPLGRIYGAVAERRMSATGARAGVPVICVGNFTLGGAGKTPTVIMLAGLLASAGKRVFCLSRGYGGDVTGAKLVDAHQDKAAHVGDEALLIAHVAPIIVARDRVAGAALAREQGAELIVMDDGLQNPSLMKDFTLAVVDARRGLGNGLVFPAGPLRAPLKVQLAKTDGLLVVGDGNNAEIVSEQCRSRALPVFHGRLIPDPAAVESLKGRRVLAFAGISDPEKFFATAVEADIEVAQRRAFADHHRFTAEEAAELIMQAEHSGLALLTTEKDHARMAGDPLLEALALRAHTLRVSLVVEQADELQRLMTSNLRH